MSVKKKNNKKESAQKKQNRLEDALHRDVWRWIQENFPESRDDVVIYSVENRSRNAIEGYHRKLRGCIAGVPDIAVVTKGSVIHYIELKTKTGQLNPAQKVLHARLKRLGSEIEICRSLNDIKCIISKWCDKQYK